MELTKLPINAKNDEIINSKQYNSFKTLKDANYIQNADYILKSYEPLVTLERFLEIMASFSSNNVEVLGEEIS